MTDKQTQTTDLDLEALLSDAELHAQEVDDAINAQVEAGELDENFEAEAKSEQKSKAPASKPVKQDRADRIRAEREASLEARLAEPVKHVDGDLKQMIGDVDQDTAKKVSDRVIGEIASRQEFEAKKNAKNETIQKKLKGYSAKLSNLKMCQVLVATDTDVGFINREISEGSRFNIYAIDKLNDLVMALETGHLNNAINNAVCRTIFKFRAEGLRFTGEVAQACASDKIRLANKAIEKHMVRHTVGASTAPTQASSTMNALETLGMVENRGTRVHPVWVLTDTPQTRRLEELLAA